MKIVVLILILFQSTFAVENLSIEWQKKINEILSKTLDNYHYVDQDIDDNYSKRVFRLFLNKLDPNKTFFTENQIPILQRTSIKLITTSEITPFTFIIFVFYV